MNLKSVKKNTSKFLSNIFIMLRGTIVAQIVATIGGFYMAKFYGTQSYGVYASVVSISFILSLIFTMQLDKVIVLSKSIEKKKDLISFLVYFIVIMALIVSLSIYALNISFKNLPSSIGILSAIAAGLLGIFITYESLFVSNKKFKILSNFRILMAVFTVIFQFLFFKLGYSNGLIYGFLTALITLVICFVVKNNNYTYLNRFWNVKVHMKTHKDILSYLLPSNVINGVGIHVMPILIVAFFDLKITAVYFLSIKILGIPLNLMSLSIGNVFFEKISATELKNSKFKRLKKIVISNMIIMLLFLLTLNTVGRRALTIFFGLEWGKLSLFLIILSFLYFARASFNPVSSIIIVERKNHIGLIFNVYLVLVNLIAIYVGHNFSDILYTLCILSFFGGIGYFSLLYYFIRLLKNAK